MEKILIRTEKSADYRKVEEVTREAFWNLYVPGCDEHYLIHQLRNHPDFLPDLTFVAEVAGEVVGSIFFTKSYVLDEKGVQHETLTFGPVSVLPAKHNQGIGTALIEHSKKKALALGYKAILIYGYLPYYSRFGFVQGKELNIRNGEGKFPAAHLVCPLVSDPFNGLGGQSIESSAFEMDESAVLEYDFLFPPKEKKVEPSQALFAKTVNSFL